CSATWACRSAPRGRKQNGQAVQDCPGEAQAEVPRARLPPLPPLRAESRLFEQVRDVPHLLPQPCVAGRSHRSDQEQLVAAEKEHRAGAPFNGYGQPEETTMSMTDPIADLLTRIRNAQRAGLEQFDVPASKIKQRICEVLGEEGFVREVSHKDDGKQGILTVTLKYDPEKRPAISEIRRQSRPGLRRYVSYQDIPPVMNGLGIAVLS